ncbi:MAG: miaA, partial [Parcubacteria group bacterium]|nr:miaA [Parcubacteria group bacterium]
MSRKGWRFESSLRHNVKKVLIIIGPTASGKTSLGIQLAKKLNGEVISADSRQIYKGLDIATGKVTKKEMRGIPHHLLDVADSKKVFSVSDYKILATDALEEILQKEKLPVIVGGTGFYIDALTGTASLPKVPPNPILRARLEKKPAETLFKMLQKKDPRRAKMLDPRNKVRVIR